MPSGTYTKVFGGSILYPSEISYLDLNTAVNLAFAWPVEGSTTLPTIARIVDVTTTAPGCFLRIPDATLVGLGETVLFVNKGAQTFTVEDYSGNPILTSAPGTAWQIYLRDNSTSAGTWASFQYGAQASSVNVAAIAGYGLQAISATLNSAMPASKFAVNTTLTAADRANTFVWTGGAGTLTLPSAATVGAGWFIGVRNGGTGTLDVTPVGGDLINETSSLATSNGDSALIVSDGADYFTIGFGAGSGGGGSGFDFLVISLAGLTGTYTLSGGELNKIGYRFTGALAGAIKIVVPATVQEYWVDNQATGGALTIATAAQVSPLAITSGTRKITYCDGSNVYEGDTQSAVTLPLTVANGGTGATTVGAARTALDVLSAEESLLYSLVL